MSIKLCTSRVNEAGRELVAHGTALFPVSCYRDELPADLVPLHWHEEFEIGIVAEGQLALHIDTTTVVLKTGQGYFSNSTVLHGGESPDGTRCMVHSIVFHPRLIGGVESIFWQRYISNLLQDTAARYFILDREADWGVRAIALAESVYALCEAEPRGYEIRVRNALSEFILLMDERVTLCSQLRPTEAELRAAERAKIMLQYIQQHLAEELKTSDIAQSASISQSECLRCFTKIVGEPPSKYIKHLRIQRAAELLRGTNRRVAEIASDCGFYDMSYFSKVFREARGCTPSEYRKGCGEREVP